MKNEIELLSTIDDGLQIRIFGKKVKDVSINTSRTKLFSEVQSKLILAKVYGSRVLDNCITFSNPFYTILPDNGTKPDGCGAFGDPNEYLMWIFPKSQTLAKLSLETDTLDKIVSDIVSPRLNIDSDFHIHDFSITGTTLSGKLKAYLHLHQPGPFGTTIFDITVVNGDYPFSINLASGTCITVFTIAVASAQICFYDKPNRVCGTVDVGIDLPVLGHWGKKFDIACVNLPTN